MNTNTIDATRTPAATPKKKKSVGTVILVIALIYVGLAILDALGLFVMGSYYEDGKKSDDDVVELKFAGGMGGEDGEEGMTYVLEGDEIIFMVEGEEYVSGKISNGVLRIDILGFHSYYCKDGKTEDDFDEFSVVDTLRTLLSPVSKLVSKLIN